MAVFFKSGLVSAVALALSLGLSSAASADSLTENFDNGIPADWTVKNLSVPLGVENWFQGDTEVFGAHQGAANSYVAANFNSGGEDAGNNEFAAISDWLILPTSTYQNGDTLSFFTRTSEASKYPDRLEVRFSSVGGTDVGNTASSVGTFTDLLLTINPNLEISGYPEVWTEYTVTLSGLSSATAGAFAIRYAVEEAGPNGIHSNYIGIDSLNVTSVSKVSPVPEPSIYAALALGLGLVGVMSKRKRA